MSIGERVCRLLVSAFAMSFAVSTAVAQSAAETKVSRFDIYGGYGYIKPIASDIHNVPYRSVYNPNATVSATYFLSPRFGLQAEGGYFSSGSQRGSQFQCAFGCAARDQMYYTAQAGPVLRFRSGSRLTPFAHLLAGGARLNGPELQPLKWGIGGTAGFGVDYVLPYHHDLFALRLIQADGQYMRVDHGPSPTNSPFTGIGQVTAIKLSAGLVARFGDILPKQSLSDACNAHPISVYAGEPVTAEASAVGENPKKPVTYTWSASGGRLTPAGATATIDTDGLAPGTYEISNHLSQGKRADAQASCISSFTVKPFDPPEIACSASPATVRPGSSVTVTAAARSPQNRSLTYSYTTTAGQINGNGTTATLSTSAVNAGPITVTCSVVDDLGKTASATARVTVSLPPPPPMPQTRNLCTVSFDRDRRRPTRVDNQGKACLDDIALTMNHEAGSRLVIVGNADSREDSRNAAARALNTRDYLVQEKAIDLTRVEVREGSTTGRTAESILVPAGATVDVPIGTLLDPATRVAPSRQYHRTARGVKHRTTRRHLARPKRKRRR